MDEDERLLRIALWMIPGITAEVLAVMVSRFGSLRQAMELPRAHLASLIGLGPGAARALEQAPSDLRSHGAAIEAALVARGGRFLLEGDGSHPDLPTLDRAAPVLALRGRLGHAGEGREPRAVAVIGSRHADPGALRLARRMGGALADAGFTVVSGGALGVDAAAHLGALEAGGSTVAVLGSGVLCPSPSSNRRLFARMLEEGGGLVSELPPLQRASSWNFPRRNRLIAALSRAVIVVRAGWPSGCTHTVEAARLLGRKVFAVPAPELGERAAGCTAYLESGATAVDSEDALLEHLGAASRRATADPHLSPEERQVLDALSSVPVPLLLVAGSTGMAPGSVARVLAHLCGKGLVRPQGPGCFVRS